MLPQNVCRVMAWLALATILALSLVPPGGRPTTFFPHEIEHAGIFFVDGIAFAVAYRGYTWLLSIGAGLFCAAVELAQLMVPGRHARLSDFFVDAAAAVIGIFASSTLIRMMYGYD